MKRPIRSATEVEMRDFTDASVPLLERTLNFGLSGLAVVAAKIDRGDRRVPTEEADVTIHLAEVLADMFTAQCDIAFDIAGQLPAVSDPEVELYRKRAHQFAMTAVNEVLRDIWEQMRTPEQKYDHTMTVLQNIVEPFANTGMLQPHWIQFAEVRQTLQQVPVPYGLFVRTLGQKMVGLDRRQATAS